MTTTAQWLARGACYYGHAIHGPDALYRHASGWVECDRCRRDMEAERGHLRAASTARRAAGRSR